MCYFPHRSIDSLNAKPPENSLSLIWKPNAEPTEPEHDSPFSNPPSAHLIAGCEPVTQVELDHNLGAGHDHPVGQVIAVDVGVIPLGCAPERPVGDI